MRVNTSSVSELSLQSEITSKGSTEANVMRCVLIQCTKKVDGTSRGEVVIRARARASTAHCSGERSLESDSSIGLRKV